MHGVVHPPAVNRGHHHLAGFQQAYCLFTFFPPFNVGFDPVQNRERSIDTGFGGQHLINVAPGNAVCNQCPFQVPLGAAAQAASPGKLFQVKKVFQGFGAFFKPLPIVTDHRRAHHVTHATGHQTDIDEILTRRCTIRRGRQALRVNGFKQAFFTGTNGIEQFQVHHIPLHIPGAHLATDFLDAPGVLNHIDPGTGLILIRTNETEDLTFHIGPVPGHDIQLIPGRRLKRKQGQGQRHDGRYLKSLSHKAHQ